LNIVNFLKEKDKNFRETPVPEIKVDGCGAYYIYVNFDSLGLTGFNECCNQHDFCYSSCGKKKSICDIEFTKCLISNCESICKTSSYLKDFVETCFELSYYLNLFVTNLGCSAFKKAQSLACDCATTDIF